MPRLFNFSAALLGLQMLAVVCSGATKHSKGIDSVGVISGFTELQEYLTEKVKSKDLGENLQAARELYACKSKTGRISSLIKVKQEKSIQKVARRFVELVEVATQADEKCTEQTLDYLGDLLNAYSFQVFSGADEATGRLHLHSFGRVDELLDPQLESIVRKCEQYLNDTHRHLLAKLNPKVKKQVYDIFSDEMLQTLPTIRSDHRIITTDLAKQRDFDNYKAALESKDRQTFENYFRAFYREHLTKPCKVFYQQFDKFMDSKVQLQKFSDRYRIPIERSKEFALHLDRCRQCYVAAVFSTDSILSDRAGKILEDYLADVRTEQVNWDRQADRWLMGKRIY